MQAVVLAGGKGTRLRPYTSVFPKPLVPLGDMPVLELILRQLKQYGFTEVILAVGYLHALIKAYFGDGSKLGIKLRYSYEEQPLGTIGPLGTIADLDETFLVMNGDVVSDLRYDALYRAHKASDAPAMLALYNMTTQLEFGVMELSPGDTVIQAFREKPSVQHAISMGVHVFHKSILELIPPQQLYGLDHLMADLLERQQQAGSAPQVRAYPFEGYWLDIGRHRDYESALEEFELMKHRLLPEITEQQGATLTPLSGNLGGLALSVKQPAAYTLQAPKQPFSAPASYPQD